MVTTCTTCRDPLVLSFAAEDDDQGHHMDAHTVPDDLELPCGCHFHWQCLLDQASDVAVSLRCPSCATYLPSNRPGPSVTNPFLPSASGEPGGASIPARYTSEGSGAHDPEPVDMLPLLTEEAFLASHPEARPARAMHIMAAEGDVQGILDLLRDADAAEDEDEDEEEEGEGEQQRAAPIDAVGLLRWADPLNGARTALHVAVAARQEEVFWLLLWLGSDVASNVFPEQVVRAARDAGLEHRRRVERTADVRFLRDGSGRGVADLMVEMGPPWSHYVEGGLFS